MNIFEALRHDHNTQRNLVNQLVETHGDTTQRHSLFTQLKEQLSSHAAAEEKAFYVYLLKDDLSQEKARHAIAEHHEIDEMVEELEELDAASPSWLPKAKTLRDKVHHHLDEEEHEFFQIAGKVLTENQKDLLSSEFEEEKQEQLS